MVSVPSRVVGSFAHVFDDLVAVAAGACGAGAVGAWARVENAVCAQRLFAIADVLAARMSADDSVEREQWCIDNWDAVAAEVAAAHNVSLGVASHQLMLAKALRERLPRVAQVFAAGLISYRLVNAIVYRTALVRDPEARARIDSELAAAAVEWGSMSAAKVETAVSWMCWRSASHTLPLSTAWWAMESSRAPRNHSQVERLVPKPLPSSALRPPP